MNLSDHHEQAVGGCWADIRHFDMSMLHCMSDFFQQIRAAIGIQPLPYNPYYAGETVGSWKVLLS